MGTVVKQNIFTICACMHHMMLCADCQGLNPNALVSSGLAPIFWPRRGEPCLLACSLRLCTSAKLRQNWGGGEGIHQIFREPMQPWARLARHAQKQAVLAASTLQQQSPILPDQAIWLMRPSQAPDFTLCSCQEKRLL